jgi:hypothetical protein
VARLMCANDPREFFIQHTDASRARNAAIWAETARRLGIAPDEDES